jgi:hypothetical protein
MQVNKIGEPLPSSGGQFLRMRQSGDKVQFRIAQEPVFEGKHFTPTEGGKWVVTSCPRINDGDPCDLCETFFAGMAEAKKYEESGDKEKSAACKDSIPRGCKPSFIYYFPILNRDTGKMALLQTTAGVKKEMDKKAGDGVKVFDRDWILRNTGSASPKDLYSLTVVDSAETKKIVGDEIVEFEKALNYDMLKINSGSTAPDTIAETAEEALSDEQVEEIDKGEKK